MSWQFRPFYHVFLSLSSPSSLLMWTKHLGKEEDHFRVRRARDCEQWDHVRRVLLLRPGEEDLLSRARTGIRQDCKIIVKLYGLLN